MTRGTRHIVTGTLRWDARNHMYLLNTEGGGFWFVDMPWRSRHLIGRTVMVEGERSGFNILDVQGVLAIDGAPLRPRRRAIWASLRRRLGMVTA